MQLSVLIPFYSQEDAEYLEKCLHSIWSYQSRKPDQVVLVQDGPVGKALEDAVQNWKERIGDTLTVVVLPQNVGLGRALRIGLEACKGDFVARIDADDFAHSNRFATQLAFMTSNPNVDVLGSAANLVDANGQSIGTRNMPIRHEQIRQLIWSCPILHPSVLFKRSRIVEIGSYCDSVPHRQEDYELWIRAVRSGLIFHNLSDPLTYYRVSSHKKNDLAVGWNRFKVGWSAVREFDPSIRAWLGIFYPLFRGILPHRLEVWLDRRIRRWDPR